MKLLCDIVLQEREQLNMIWAIVIPCSNTFEGGTLERDDSIQKPTKHLQSSLSLSHNLFSGMA